ncbi:MAG TPA: tRNA pseudouridine(55) synthase TruB [Ilumatobacter sp.]|nr:tRNA pseudouridine(55) synthase TruB [Ilumatobacter sp.]
MARRKPPTTHGLCVVDKPPGVTSHDVVAMLRKRFNERQVGHAGTLDPDATGVLVIAVGKTTKLLRFVEKTTKRYAGEIVLGTATSTLDSSGEITGTFDMSAVTVDDARRLVNEHLMGSIEQIPPMVSAIKVDGKRLHELARAGIEIERAPRHVHIFRFDVEQGPEPGVLAVDVECTAGTYIRTLADDLGRLLGGGAHLRNLRRTAVGEFLVDEALPPDEAVLQPIGTTVRGLTRVDVDAAVTALVEKGRVLPLDGFVGTGPWALFDPAGDLIAVYEQFRERGEAMVKPAVVLPPG